MERFVIYNGISPYIYFLAVLFAPSEYQNTVLSVCFYVFLVQLLATVIISIIGKDKKKLAKLNMIVKLIQIPYYIIFFIVSVLGVFLGMGLMGAGLLFIPIFIAIDIGVFLSTLIPEEACTIKLKKDRYISTGKFVVYLIGNAFYVVDIILSILIRKEYDRYVIDSTNTEPADD